MKRRISGIKRAMLQAARSRLGGKLVGWLMEHLSFALPVQRVLETETLLAFHHPQPAYALHLLIVPKKRVEKLTELGAGDSQFFVELYEAVGKLVAQFGLEKGGYRLVANGGKFQEVAQVHFHLIGETNAGP